jgi:hypothetical protein
VNAKLGKHRDEIEQLNNVRGLLKKLQCVFDLPGRLRACVETGSLGSAVREYAAAAPLLERYGTGAFASVAREVSGTVKEIGDRLRATLRDPATRPDDAAEALELLQMLRLPQDELQREWLSERRKALNDAMHAASAEWASACAPGGTHVDVANWLSGLNAAYLAELMQTAKSYREVRVRGVGGGRWRPCARFVRASCLTLWLVRPPSLPRSSSPKAAPRWWSCASPRSRTTSRWSRTPSRRRPPPWAAPPSLGATS